MRKYTIVLLVLAFLLGMGIYWPVSADATVPQEEVHITEADTILVGFWEEWLHADGKTWQDTDHDGDKHNPPEMDSCVFTVPIPEGLKAEYDNIHYVVIPFKSEQDREGNELPENEPYNNTLYIRDKDGYAGVVAEYPAIKKADGTQDNFRKVVLYYTPPEYSLVSEKTVKLYKGGQYLDVKRPDQEELVQGRRWLLPALVEYYGTPKEEEPLTPPEPESLPCAEKPSITNTWEVQYHWTTTSHYTDSEGKSHTRTRHHYKNVPYSETLTATLTVNTKQGIANGGRESRGAWEIIPWAKQNRLDPNEVTRSGYGFEVKLVTAYSNDWETKVPAGASSKGGTFKGPDKAVAEFYDTKGRFVKRVNMIPTKGKAGDNNVAWELPSERYTFQDGQTIYERKHYTDISVPDGKYQVNVTVSGAGKTELCLIQKKYVTIYKDMWEDSYTRVAQENE